MIHFDNGAQINADSLRWNCFRPKIAPAKCQGAASDKVTDRGGVIAISHVLRGWKKIEWRNLEGLPNFEHRSGREKKLKGCCINPNALMERSA